MSNTANRSINIYVNSGEAQRAYDNLTERNQKLQKQLERTTLQQKKLVSAIANGDQQAVKENEKLIAKVKELNDTMANNSQRASVLQRKLSGELSPSMKELATTVARLRKELYSMSSEEDGFAEKVKHYNEAKASLDQYANKLVSVRNKWSDMMKSAKGVAFGMIVGNSIQSATMAISGYFNGMIQGAGKLSDSLADVQRLTNMSADEVAALNSEFKKIDTRTSTEKLREMAMVAGRLGIAKEDVLDFVKATDMLQVSLGAELGDVDQITTDLGRIINVYGDGAKITGEGMTNIGNALVHLANTGTATGGFIVEFTNRLAGLRQTAKVSLPDVMGLGAGLQEMGQNVEMSGTAVAQMITRIAIDVPKHAKIAGKSVEEFSNTLKTAPVEALIQVSEGLVKGKGSFEEISKAFNDAGLDGARLVTILATIGGKADFMRGKMAETNDVILKSNEILAAFGIKNNTLGADLDKLGKKLTAFMNSGTVIEFFTNGVGAVSKFIDVLSALPKFIIENRNYIILLATAYALYNRALLANAIQTAYNTVLFRAQYTWLVITEATTKLVAIATNAYAFAQGVLTGRITLAVAIQRVQNALSIASGNIFTIVATAVTLLAGAMALYYANISKAFQIQKLYNDIKTESAKKTAEEKASLESLLLIAKDETIEKGKRLEAIKKINEISPEYLGNLNLENINTEKGTELIKAYIVQLDKKSTAEAIQSKMIELKKKLIEQENSALEDNIKWNDYLTLNSFKNQFNASKLQQSLDVQAIANKNKATKAIQEQIEALNKLTIAKVKSGDMNVSDMANTSSTTSTSTTTSKTTTTDKTKENLDKTKDELEAFRKKLLEVKRELEGNTGSEYDQVLNNAREQFIKLGEEAKKFGNNILPSLQAEINKLEQTKLDQVISGLNTKNLESEYNQALASLGDYFADVRSARKQDYANGLISEYQYNQALKQLQTDELTARLITIENYEKVGVERSHADKLKAEKELQQNITDNALAEAKERADADTSNANIAVSKAKRLGNIDAIKQAELNQLAIWYAQEQNQYRGNKQKLLEIEEEYQNRLAGITQKSTKKSIDTISLLPEGVKENYKKVVGEISQIVGGINTLVNSIGSMLQQQTEQQIASVNRRTETEDKYLKEQLDNKLISQEAYDQKKAQLDRKAAEELKRLRIKQFEQEKAMKLIQAGINVALGVTQAIAQTGVGAIVAGVLVAAAGAVEIAAIASAQPPSYGDGTILDGPKHSDKSKGLPIINPYTGQVLARVEGGEAVIPDATVQANRPLIDHMLANKGKSIYQQTMARYMQVPNLNSSRIASNVQMANGGYILNASNRYTTATSESLQRMQAMNDKYLKDISKYTKTQAGKEMSISLTEINRKEKFINGKKAVAI